MSMLELSGVARVCEVAIATMCTILCNFPMWIAAKRMGAGLKPFPPTLRSLYKGSGALWLSLGPTNILEDSVFAFTQSRIVGTTGSFGTSVGSALCAGFISAILVTSPVEHAITIAHRNNCTLFAAGRTLPGATASPSSLLTLSHRLPPGTFAVCLRESCFVFFLFRVRPQVAAAIADTEPARAQSRHAFYLLTLEVCSGVATALLAAPISHPAARIAAYMQGQSSDWRGVVREMTTAAVPQPVPPGSTVSSRYCHLYRSCSSVAMSARWLFCGLLPRALSMAGTFTVFPLTLQLLSSSSGRTPPSDISCE